MLSAALQTSQRVLRSSLYNTAPKAIVASDVAVRMFSSRAMKVNQSQNRAPLRQPPTNREPLRDSLRKQRQQAVAQLRELERRAKLHKPVVDIPTPHIGEHRDIENVLRLGESSLSSSSLTEFREMQTRTKKPMPHFFSVDQQWKRAMGN